MGQSATLFRRSPGRDLARPPPGPRCPRGPDRRRTGLWDDRGRARLYHRADARDQAAALLLRATRARLAEVTVSRQRTPTPPKCSCRPSPPSWRATPPTRTPLLCSSAQHRPTMPVWSGSPTNSTPSEERYARHESTAARRRRGRGGPRRSRSGTRGDRDGRGRPGPGRHRTGHRPSLPRPRPAGGHPRCRQDPAGTRLGRGGRTGNDTRPVHSGPDAQRRHRLPRPRRPHVEVLFQPGPVLTNLLRAYEINRTLPKRQASRPWRRAR